MKGCISFSVGGKKHTALKKTHLKQDFTKIENFCSTKTFVPIRNMKRQAVDQVNIFAIHVSDKELLSRICKELPTLHRKKKKNTKLFKQKMCKKA